MRRSRIPGGRRLSSEREDDLGRPIVYFEIVGEDAGLLQTYYSELLGWRFDSDVPSRGFAYVSVRADGAGLDGAIGAAPPGTSGYVTFYVRVTDVEATLARAHALGGKRIFGPDAVSDTLELGMFKDPEDHVVGVLADHHGAPGAGRHLPRFQSCGALGRLGRAASNAVPTDRELGQHARE
jgi:uncharacterized protein